MDRRLIVSAVVVVLVVAGLAASQLRSNARDGESRPSPPPVAPTASEVANTGAADAANDLLKCDFNGDGFADQPVGAPGEDRSEYDQGAVTVLYGTAEGLISAGADHYTQSTPGIAGVARWDEEFGRVVRCGDFNGDAYGDLVIAAPRDDVRLRAEDPERPPPGCWHSPGPPKNPKCSKVATVSQGAGSMHVLFGSPGGLRVRGSQRWTLRDVGQTAAEANVARFGGGYFQDDGIDVGDFNGDGIDDVIGVGRPRAFPDGADPDGAVVVLFGTRGVGFRPWTPDRFQVVSSALPTPLRAGDFNGDGHDDVVFSGSTQLWVSYGGIHGLDLSAASATELDYPGAAAQFGRLVTGDINGDELDDLAFIDRYTPRDDLQRATDPIGVVFGTRQGLPQTVDQHWPASGRNPPLTIADFDGDGYGDLVKGGRCDRNGADFGCVEIIRGSARGLTGTGRQSFQLAPNATGDLPLSAYIAHKHPTEWDPSPFVEAAVGDRTGDGFPDLTAAGPGGVRLFRGGRDGLSARKSQMWSQDTPGVHGTSEEGDEFAKLD